MTTAHEELIEFIAAGTSPQSIVDFQPSDATKARVWDLVRRQKNEGLSDEETAELNSYLQLEHLMRLAKARAYQHLDPAS